MLFNSLHFAAFFPIVFALHWVFFRRSKNGQNILLLIASYYFYGSWDWRFLSLLIFTTSFDFFLGREIFRSESEKRRKILLAIAVGGSLTILGFFKYYNFFAAGFAALMAKGGIHVDPFTLNIILPVGISFYTFQSISYSIDIYRRKIEPTNDLIAFFTYVAFFPQLVAGPIERSSHLIPQFLTARTFKNKQARDGCRLILWGLFKKIAIADTLAALVDTVYKDPSQFNGLSIALATLCFAFQIYCDFSGYSDIARGTARLLGIELMINFRTPYFSKSIKEFWTRWHISLSTWFRDYLYIPLGGNRCGLVRWALAIFITFLISGLWHGANLTFIIWGAIHGITYLMEWLMTRHSQSKFAPIKLVQGFLTFCIVWLAWVFFRAADTHQAVDMLNRIFNSTGTFDQPLQLLTDTFHGERGILIFLAFFLIFLIGEAVSGQQDINAALPRLPIFPRWATYYILVAGIAFFGNFVQPQTFIYFQF
jgi:alginate O-acetyltransferase complex protein AlgI